MAVSVVASGSQTAVIGTEHPLKIEQTAGVYIFLVDTANMIAGDTLELRTKSKARSTDSVRQEEYQTYSGAQDDTTDAKSKLKEVGPLTTDNYIEVTLKQTAGTGRAFPWALLRVN